MLLVKCILQKSNHMKWCQQHVVTSLIIAYLTRLVISTFHWTTRSSTTVWNPLRLSEVSQFYYHRCTWLYNLVDKNVIIIAINMQAFVVHVRMLLTMCQFVFLIISAPHFDGLKVQAVYKYDAQMSCDLSFNPGMTCHPTVYFVPVVYVTLAVLSSMIHQINRFNG